MAYTRPAVYVERADALGPPPIVLRTDIAAFVGIARQGPLDTPVPVESFRQFAAHFGDFTGAAYLAYAVRGFFENGGRRCWVVRVANKDAAAGAGAASVAVADTAGRVVFRVFASSPGTWGNALTIEIAFESGATAIGLPDQGTPRYATVDSVAQFERSTLARIEQVGTPPLYRVVSAVDADTRRLYWVHPRAGAGLPTDLQITGFDLTMPMRVTRVAYSITVREGGVVRAVYRDLHLVHSHRRYGPQVLKAPSYTPYWLRDEEDEEVSDLPRPPEPIVLEPPRDEYGEPLADESVIPDPLQFMAGIPVALSGGTDGLATLAPFDFTGEPVVAGDSDFVKARKQRGLQSITMIEEIALVAMPDVLIRPEPDPLYEPVPPPEINPCVWCPPPPPRRDIHQPLSPGELPPAFSDEDIARMQAALVEHCETMGDRFAILSPPLRLASDLTISREEIVAWRALHDTRYAALYLPWLDVIEPRRTAPTRRIPACGHVTGAIARTDITWGVHRAPGNLSLDGVTDVSRQIDDHDHGDFNVAGLNVIRGEFGRPPVVGGARTLSRDYYWRFINIVRLVLLVKKGIEVLLRWAVFEPNDQQTRASIAATITALLTLFHERGAFKGATPEESFFVRCDEVTTPRDVRDAGQLIALVGIAPAAPCEFIVLRVGKQRNTLAVALYEEVEAAHA
jgi:phage tail sheath protein FI